MLKVKENSLYLVSSEEYSQGKKTFEIAQEAVLGGVDIFQMREKHKTYAELIELGKELASLCKENNVIFIVNDNPELAAKVDADGVHLGQEDIEVFSIEKTREILGKDKIIGLSTHSVEQFQIANESDLDYIAFGPIFSTKTKNYTIGIGDISQVMKTAKKPVVFIGGINLENIETVLKKGAKNIAVIRSIVGADDIGERIGEFKRMMMK